MPNITHQFVSTLPDGTDPTLVRPSNWNQPHTIDATGVLIGTNSTSIQGVAASTRGSYLQRMREASSVTYQFSSLARVEANDFNFTVTGNVPLAIATPATVTLSFMPSGITAGSVNKHYVSIIDAIGGNEIVLITAWTATTISFTPALNHLAANYTIGSATSGLQEAIKWTEAQPDGGGINLNRGITWINARVFFAGVPAVALFGCGKQATNIFASFSSGDLFYCDNSSQLLGFYDFAIGVPGSHTSGAAFHLKDNTGGHPVLSNLRIDQCFQGVWIDNSDFITILNCEIIGYPNASASDHVYITGSSGDITIVGGVFMDAEINTPALTNYSIRIEGADGITIIGTHIRANVGIAILCPTGGIVGTVLISNCIIDRCREQQVLIAPSGTPALLVNVVFSGCHIMGSTAMEDIDLVDVNTTLMGTAKFGLTFSNCVIGNGNRNNLHLVGVNTLILDGNRIANANSRNNGGSAVRLVNCSRVNITGNILESTLPVAQQQYGIVIGGTFEDSCIVGNVVQGNASASLNNIGTVSGSVIKQNSGLNTIRPFLTSAATLDVSDLCDTYVISGTTTIQTINGATGSGDVRYFFCGSVGLVFGTSGNIANTLTTSAVGQVVIAVWDAVDSKWRLR